jgi:M6 family metalloprotease-like protein
MRKNFIAGKLYLCILILLFVSQTIQSQKQFPKPKYKARSYGVPAAPDELKLAEPDGSKLIAFLKGDGAVHWYQTPDGYTIIKGKNGYFEYAEHDAQGNLKTSGIRVNNKNKSLPSVSNILVNTPKDLRYSKSQVETLKNNFLPVSTNEPSNAFPASGTLNLLLILIDFPDRAHTFPSDNFNNLMNQTGYNGTGSFKDYYSANSFGQLNIVTTVTGWYTASHNHDYYCDDCLGANKNVTYKELVREAVDAAEADGVDFSGYDNDGDGVVDGVMVIHQGEGAERGDLRNIWSHSSSLGFLSVSYDGVIINDYTLNPETSNGLMGTIGVLCHEFGHNLGLPDYYDTDYAGSGGQSFDLGNWDCMANGAYNNGSATPANHNSYSRNILGWQTAQELTTASKVTLLNAAQNNISYYYSTPTANEYFWVENRQQISGTFDQYIPGHGMLIYHIDMNHAGWNNNTINTNPLHNAMDIEEADNIKTSATYTGDPFPGSSNRTSFTDNTVPNANAWSNSATNKPITNLTENSGLVSFDFMGGDPNIPLNFLATAISSNQINLTWNLNSNSNPVLVAWSSTGVFGTPVNGVTYSTGK